MKRYLVIWLDGKEWRIHPMQFKTREAAQAQIVVFEDQSAGIKRTVIEIEFPEIN